MIGSSEAAFRPFEQKSLGSRDRRTQLRNFAKSHGYKVKSRRLRKCEGAQRAKSRTKEHAVQEDDRLSAGPLPWQLCRTKFWVCVPGLVPSDWLLQGRLSSREWLQIQLCCQTGILLVRAPRNVKHPRHGCPAPGDRLCPCNSEFGWFTSILRSRFQLRSPAGHLPAATLSFTTQP